MAAAVTAVVFLVFFDWDDREALLAAAQLVVVADVADHEPVERAALTAGQAAGVEDGGDLGMGVVIE